MCRSQKLNMLSSSNFQLSLFLMSTNHIYIQDNQWYSPKWVGFGKLLLYHIVHHYCMYISYPPCLCNCTPCTNHPHSYMHMHALTHSLLHLPSSFSLLHSHTHSFTHSLLHSPSSSSLLRARVSAISLTMGCSLASRTWRCS